VAAETALASRELRRSTADEFVLRRQLDQLHGYDVVLVDCPPSLGVLTLNALTAASRLLVVTEPNYLALQGIDELLETSNLVRAHYNPGLELGGVIVNRVERTVEHRLGLAEIASPRPRRWRDRVRGHPEARVGRGAVLAARFVRVPVGAALQHAAGVGHDPRPGLGRPLGTTR
jgi:hypothetical protein